MRNGMKNMERNNLIGKEFQVLDHGFIRVVDFMGDDLSVVQAARVSTGTGTKGDEKDRKLLNYLMKHQHTSPFEQCEIKLHVKLPIFVARQWIRHRTGHVNEFSARYSEIGENHNFYIPSSERILGQDKMNKQRSAGEINITTKENYRKEVKYITDTAYQSYNYAISKGISRELARIILPVNMYTEWYWKQDLHNLLHFLRLRMAEDAQWEIRQYANVIGNEIVANWVPWTWEAFKKHRLSGEEK